MAVQYKEKRRVIQKIRTPQGDVSVPVDIIYPSNKQDYIDGSGEGVQIKLPTGELLGTTQKLSEANSDNSFLRIDLADANDPVWDTLATDIKSRYSNITIQNFNGALVRDYYIIDGQKNKDVGFGQTDKIISQQRTQQLNAAELNDLTVNAGIADAGAKQRLNLNSTTNTENGDAPAEGAQPKTDNPLKGIANNESPLAFNTKSPSKNFNAGGAMYYPKEMSSLQEDYIKIVSKRYIPDDFSDNSPLDAPTAPGSPEATIYLPIQSQLNDANSVSWGPHQMNPIQRELYKSGYNIISGQNFTEDVGKELGKLKDKITRDLTSSGDSIAKAFSVYFASQAVGVGNMLSRAGGAILNPNMMLLFNNPDLRKFTLNFKFTPRNPDESKSIRKIIRALKQTSSVRKDETNLFLLAPNIFEVTMHQGGNQIQHKSIGRKKVCALISVNTNYVPDGSYMTFEDASLTSYTLELSFNEITPIYYDDYVKANLQDDEIGY
jgi:hypothetical protein